MPGKIESEYSVKQILFLTGQKIMKDWGRHKPSTRRHSHHEHTKNRQRFHD